MKLISFIIPSYNSEGYLHQAVDSLLSNINDLEIIIVDDGSKDHTLEIALAYQKNYPEAIKVIHQENKGHGGAINQGLVQATGIYIKVLDSDDWIDKNSLDTLIKKMKDHQNLETLPDLYITNFVYEHVEDQTFFVRDYSQNFVENRLFTWSKIKKRFKYSKTLLMHALIYKKSVLSAANLVLPEHTFYVDNIFAYVPLPFVYQVYYMNLPLYRYFIGRSDQSITMKNITSRYNQQIKVFKIMSDAYRLEFIKRLPKALSKYMIHNLSAMMIITQMFTVANDSKERRDDLKALWNYVKFEDKSLYHYLKYQSYNTAVHFLPWKLKSYLMVKSYLYLAKKVKLG